MATFKVGELAKQIAAKKSALEAFKRTFSGNIPTKYQYTKLHKLERELLLLEIEYGDLNTPAAAAPQPVAADVGAGDDPLVVEYGDGYAAGYADGIKEYNALQAELATARQQLAEARAASKAWKRLAKFLHEGILRYQASKQGKLDKVLADRKWREFLTGHNEAQS